MLVDLAEENGVVLLSIISKKMDKLVKEEEEKQGTNMIWIIGGSLRGLEKGVIVEDSLQNCCKDQE